MAVCEKCGRTEPPDADATARVQAAVASAVEALRELEAAIVGARP